MSRIETGALAIVAVVVSAGGLTYLLSGEPTRPEPPALRELAQRDSGSGALRSGATDARPGRAGTAAVEPGDDVDAPRPVDRRKGSSTVQAAGRRPAEREVPAGPRTSQGFDAPPDSADAPLEGSGAEVAPRGGPGGAGGGVGPRDTASDASVDVEDAAPAAESGDVLLSIPLRGDVEPEQSNGSPQVSGVVSHGGAVEFTEDAQFTLPAEGHINSKAGTVSFSIEPLWAGADETNNSLLQIREEHRWENSLGIVKNNNSLRYVIRDELGMEANVNVYIDDWQPNERHVVTASWDEEQMALYVDGQLVGEAPLPNPVTFGPSTPIHVGSDFPSSPYRGANGRIGDLTILGTARAGTDLP